MKKLLLIAFVTLFSINSFSQVLEESRSERKKKDFKTVFGGDRIETYGRYGAFTINASKINDEDALIIGGRMGTILNSKIGFGLGGYGFLNDKSYSERFSDDVSLSGGYGGFYIEPIVKPNSPIHLSFPMLIGVGGITYMSGKNDNENEWDNSVDKDAYVVVEPGVELEINMLRSFRIAIGVYYRYTSDIDLSVTELNNDTDPVKVPLVKKDVLNGLTTGITFKFGRF